MESHAIEPPGAAMRNRPRLGDFFRASLLLGVIGFGGGLSVLANIHTLAVIKRRWMTEREFTNTITVAQMLPGGAAANAMAYTGLRFGGLKGAFLGYVGFVVPGWIAVMALAFLYVHFGATPDVATLLGGFNAAVVGVIGAITLKMARTAVGRLWQMGVAAGALLFSVLGDAPPGEVALLAIGVGLAVGLATNRPRLLAMERRRTRARRRGGDHRYLRRAVRVGGYRGHLARSDPLAAAGPRGAARAHPSGAGLDGGGGDFARRHHQRRGRDRHRHRGGPDPQPFRDQPGGDARARRGGPVRLSLRGIVKEPHGPRGAADCSGRAGRSARAGRDGDRLRHWAGGDRRARGPRAPQGPRPRRAHVAEDGADLPAPRPFPGRPGGPSPAGSGDRRRR